MSIKRENEEEEALFNTVNSVLAQWKDICTKNPILKARRTSIVTQRFKIRYSVGGNAERTKQYLI
ncbi:6978_t:CDS:2 [Diversispora eburnea]|uniref:6978_t:CDS:1 n=1 Tax=Diversispora eburnea TaxID=1213867 RepID=A0A9N9C805_9GLOM|nr:6978_t:CDS:2 [Diversispora eburnea]